MKKFTKRILDVQANRVMLTKKVGLHTNIEYKTYMAVRKVMKANKIKWPSLLKAAATLLIEENETA